jgi:hypothetical protein
MNDYEEDNDYWKRNGRPHTEEEVGWYRLWFEFLNLSDREKWTAEVTEFFGDVSGDFDDWWAEHKHLFRVENEPTVEEITTDEEYEMWKIGALDKDHLDWSGSIIVAVPLYTSKAALRASFEELLTKYHTGSAGRPSFVSDQGNLFNFYDRPDANVLNKILAVYKVFVADQSKPKQDRMKLWQIEEEASKTVELIDKTSPKADYIWQVAELVTNNEVINTTELRRRSQNTTVRKYINLAEEILENVVLGCFPVTDGSNTKCYINE